MHALEAPQEAVVHNRSCSILQQRRNVQYGRPAAYGGSSHKQLTASACWGMSPAASALQSKTIACMHSEPPCLCTKACYIEDAVQGEEQATMRLLPLLKAVWQDASAWLKVQSAVG